MLCAAWSPSDEHVLATGSVDHTVRLWDVRRSGAAACIAVLDQDDDHGHDRGGGRDASASDAERFGRGEHARGGAAHAAAATSEEDARDRAIERARVGSRGQDETRIVDRVGGGHRGVDLAAHGAGPTGANAWPGWEDYTSGNSARSVQPRASRLFSTSGLGVTGISSAGVAAAVSRPWEGGAARGASLAKAHAGAVHAVAFTPDGRHLLSAGADARLRLWHVSAAPAGAAAASAVAGSAATHAPAAPRHERAHYAGTSNRRRHAPIGLAVAPLTRGSAAAAVAAAATRCSSRRTEAERRRGGDDQRRGGGGGGREEYYGSLGGGRPARGGDGFGYGLGYDDVAEPPPSLGSTCSAVVFYPNGATGEILAFGVPR